ncbi:hypothetical protein [Coleofasciculus sp. FACHB-SPT36]|uniref:hypothetical protein n=1 Tax=Cyanophyceae TaxID=3028117 RepID=UPI00168A618E|nr:hypothetical protein [Coleofasciculus sp. FACHB-SPT36]MBD2539894.1 hypothetical protein [Coleofasciculus sp. FACHB-SPT36]
MDALELSLEILKLAKPNENNESFNNLGNSEKTSQIVASFQDIYKKVSGMEIQANPGGGTGGSGGKGKATLEILKMVAANNSFNNLDFSERSKKIIESFQEIYTQISEVALEANSLPLDKFDEPSNLGDVTVDASPGNPGGGTGGTGGKKKKHS